MRRYWKILAANSKAWPVCSWNRRQMPQPENLAPVGALATLQQQNALTASDTAWHANNASLSLIQQILFTGQKSGMKHKDFLCDMTYQSWINMLYNSVTMDNPVHLLMVDACSQLLIQMASTPHVCPFVAVESSHRIEYSN